MSSIAKFYICVRGGEYVGPHTINKINTWLSQGVLSKEWFVCRVGENEWKKISEVFEFHNNENSSFKDRGLAHSDWWHELATPKQIQRIKFFEIPFLEDNLTKGMAGTLIDAFAELDPDRQLAYETRDCSEEQVTKIRELGGDSEGLNYSEAREIIRELEQEGEEEGIELMILDNMVNDPDVIEIYRYEEFPYDQLVQLLVVLNKNVRNWKDMNRFDLGEIISKNIRKTKR